MDAQPDSSPSGTGKGSTSSTSSNEDDTAHQTLLDEARTTTDLQLQQINKIDVAAVRTVRIAFLLLGLLAGGSHLSLIPALGSFGVLGTWSLLGSLFAGLFVYGTSQLFIGSALDDLTIEYSGDSVTAATHVALIDEYEDGIRTNRRVLHLNGFVLAIARSLLALSVLFVVLGLLRHTTAPESAASTVQTLISQYSLN